MKTAGAQVPRFDSSTFRMSRKIREYLRKTPSGELLKVSPWTGAEELELLRLCERCTAREISERLGRTIKSVKARLQKLGMLDRTRSSVYSMNSASRATGYHRYQLERARDALGMKWRWQPYRGKGLWTITPKQLRQMCEYLTTEGSSDDVQRIRAEVATDERSVQWSEGWLDSDLGEADGSADRARDEA